MRRAATGAVRLTPVIASSRLPSITLSPGDSRTIGRGSQAELVVNDPSLSRLHARLTLDPAIGLVVEDLGSTNGVLINGVPQPAGVAQVGDIVAFGFVEYAIGSARDAQPSTEPFDRKTIVRVEVAQNAPPPIDQLALQGLLASSRELMGFSDLPSLLDRVLDRLHIILKPDRAAILLVDDAGELIPRAVRPQGAYTSVSQYASSTVIRQALSSRDALIISDAQLDPRLRQAESLVSADVHSAICVPLFGRAGAIGALYADTLGRAQPFTESMAQYAAAFASHAAAALETAQLYDDRERHFRATLEAFAKAIDARDPYTAGHSERVARYVLALGRAAGLAAAELETLRRGSLLHDIGKVGVPDAILGKAGPLDGEERAAIEAHPMIGWRMLEALPFVLAALPIVRWHHERWDGGGYPDQLAGADIPFHARLLAVADTYDAMTSARPYRQPLPRHEAARRLRVERGAQFDPAAIDLFDAVEPELHKLRTARVSLGPYDETGTDT